MLRVNCNLTMTTNTSFGQTEASSEAFCLLYIGVVRKTGSGGTAEKRG